METITQKILAVTLQAAWLLPYENELNWMIPAAGTFLLIPFFFVSWFSEYFIAKKMIKNTEAVIIKKQVFNANLITYLLLLLWPFFMLIKDYFL